MIDLDTFFIEIKECLALDCPPDKDTADLVRIAEAVVNQNISFVSVLPESTEVLWTWLEKTPTKIMSRFYWNQINDVSKLSEQVSHIFKKGASGAQIFVPYKMLSNFVSELEPIRDDLFFNKILSVCLNVDEINALDWEDVFYQVKKIKSDVLFLDFHNDIKSKNDFVGRIYGFLENFDYEFDGDLHLSLGNDYEKIEQIWRLVQKIRPEISPRIKFFLNI
ncbi:MAG: hypothetical protein JW985_00860 [Alphaproteobacteria bacterium]|jgi:hypothetical protein|nr:hypothetical protein [Alphaproteobacteria bacterium]